MFESLKAFKFLVIFVLFCGLSFCGLLFCDSKSVTDDSKKASLQHITLRIGWFPTPFYAPFILAQQNGYYKEKGLEVKIIHAKGSRMAVKGLANKKNDFGVVSASDVLLARGEKIPLVSLAALFQKSPFGAFSLKEKNIVKPEDLVDKRVVCNLPHWPNYKNLGYEQFIIFLRKNNLSIGQIMHIQCAHSAEVSALLAGEADVCIGLAFRIQNQLRNRGKEFNSILFADYGVNPYYYVIAAHEDTVKENPELCKKFIRATIKGWEYAIAHPDAAAEAYVNYKGKEIERKWISKFIIDIASYCINETTKKYGFGYQKKERWESAQNLLSELGYKDIEKIDINQIYTNGSLRQLTK